MFWFDSSDGDGAILVVQFFRVNSIKVGYPAIKGPYISQ